MWSFFKRRIKTEDKGVVAIEFAILLPLLLLAVVGLYDVSNFVFCNNKMNRTAQALSNIITRGDLTQTKLRDILQGANYITQPFDFTKSGNVIVTSVSKPSQFLPPQIMWRYSYPGGAGASRINLGSLPGGLVLNTNQTVIFTEVFYTYEPLFPDYVVPSTATDIYALAAAIPREGEMTTLPP